MLSSATWWQVSSSIGTIESNKIIKKKDKGHLLNLLFVTAVGISLLLRTHRVQSRLHLQENTTIHREVTTSKRRRRRGSGGKDTTSPPPGGRARGPVNRPSQPGSRIRDLFVAAPCERSASRSSVSLPAARRRREEMLFLLFSRVKILLSEVNSLAEVGPRSAQKEPGKAWSCVSLTPPLLTVTLLFCLRGWKTRTGRPAGFSDSLGYTRVTCAFSSPEKPSGHMRQTQTAPKTVVSTVLLLRSAILKET